MNISIAKKTITLLLKDIKYSNMFQLEEHQNSGELIGFHTFANNKPCLGAFLISNNIKKFWILIIDWRKNDNYYVVIYPENHQQSPLAELHKVEEHTDGIDLKWSYSPSKRDGKNQLRKHFFESQFNSLEVVVSLPFGQVELDEFLLDVFTLADCRLRADAMDETSPKIIRTTFPEGKRLEKKHKSRERSPLVIAKAKEVYYQNNNGSLPCEICAFDFYNAYSERGFLFIEAHHRVPLSELDENETIETEITDLALVCANCHRMLHRHPWIFVEDLRNILN